ncbi:MAG: hypothetical protein QM811_02230 [Pirellulales bacterium]
MAMPMSSPKMTKMLGFEFCAWTAVAQTAKTANNDEPTQRLKSGIRIVIS